MKTTVIPAQITTVEDRIAGNLTFTQILLLIAPLISSAAIYIALSPRSHLGMAKLVLIALQFLVFGLLAVRVNGKIIADWLVIYFRFSLRPRTYIFTKNDIAGREIVVAALEKISVMEQPLAKRGVRRARLSLREQVRIARLFDNPSLSVSFELPKKGGIDVSLKPIKE